jgi:hypothetical protein
MNFLSKALSFIICCVFLLSSCDSASSEQEKIYESLKENQAHITYKIEGKDFYPDESVFSGEVSITGTLMSMTLVDQFEGMTIISFGGEKWYGHIPVAKKLFDKEQVNGGIRMGKLVDKKRLIGLAYMMSEGEILLESFSKEKIVIKIKGKVGKYSDFRQPESYQAVEGTVIYKRPLFRLGGITEKELFSASKTTSKL